MSVHAFARQLGALLSAWSCIFACALYALTLPYTPSGLPMLLLEWHRAVARYSSGGIRVKEPDW